MMPHPCPTQASASGRVKVETRNIFYARSGWSPPSALAAFGGKTGGRAGQLSLETETETDTSSERRDRDLDDDFYRTRTSPPHPAGCRLCSDALSSLQARNILLSPS